MRPRRADILAIALAVVAPVRLHEMSSGTRRAAVVEARRTAAGLMRALGGFSYPEIAQEFGRRQHPIVRIWCEDFAARPDAESVVKAARFAVHQMTERRIAEDMLQRERRRPRRSITIDEIRRGTDKERQPCKDASSTKRPSSPRSRTTGPATTEDRPSRTSPEPPGSRSHGRTRSCSTSETPAPSHGKRAAAGPSM